MMIAGLIFSTQGLAEASSVTCERAMTRGSIGDISHHCITSDGFTIDVMNNDLFGGTDKYMTGAMKAGLQRFFPRNNRGFSSGFDIVVNWRALTPADKEKFSGRSLGMKIGRFADWMDTNGTYARSYSLSNDYSFKNQLSLGIGHVGNKGMREVQVMLHKLTNNPTEGLVYTGQRVGLVGSADYSMGLVKTASRLSVSVDIGAAHNAAMTEGYASANASMAVMPFLRVGTELRLIRQFRSDFYHDDIRTYRYESSAAICFFEYYQPSVKYVSPYLPGDNVGQFYGEILRFNIPI